MLKRAPEDFLVEEQPLYEPVGRGEHLYLYIEKREMTTADLAHRVAKAFRVGREHVAYAGLKDKHAVTRQHVSVHRPVEDKQAEHDAVERLMHHPKVKVLWAERHENKLRRGHHGGNRFVIKLREVEPTAVIRARPIFERIARVGVPNYVGEQRFGYRGNSGQLGRLLLEGRYAEMLDDLLGTSGPNDGEDLAEGRRCYREGRYEDALKVWPRALPFDRQALDGLRQRRPVEQVVRGIASYQRDFLVSALQSAVFNTLLNRRVCEGTWDRLLPGDLAWKHDSRALFAVDQATAALENAEAGRVPRFEVSPSGPLWGANMARATGEVDAMERRAAADHVGDPDLLLRPHPLAHTGGTRRPLRVVPRDLEYSGGVDEAGAYLRVSFELPRGSYATMVLREVIKVPHHGEDGTD